jgi:hypothetical protein
MPREGYVNIKVEEEPRRQARVTKAKLEVTWSEFLERAADELDPDS